MKSVGRRRIPLSGMGSVVTLGGLLCCSSPAFANNPPNPPILDIPANGSITDHQPLLAWGGGSDPDGDTVKFDLYLGTSSPPPLIESNLLFGIRRAPPLHVGTTYRWRIVVRDSRGAETIGPEWTFTTLATNLPPDPFETSTPSNTATGVLTTRFLSWHIQDPDGHDMFFDVYFGLVSPPPFVGTVESNYGYQGEYPYANLQFTTPYYWRIVARDPQGGVRTGPIWTFTTKANSPPQLPADPQPPHTGVGSATDLLAWIVRDVDLQPLSFDVYFGSTSPPPLVVSAITTPSYDPGELQPGVVYYWKIVASDGLLTTNGPIWWFRARQPGDVVHDNVLTPADAACALDIYMWNPACATLNTSVADVDCSANVTPADARCIHREALGLGCELCDEAIAASSPKEETIGPTISVSSWTIDENVLTVRMAVEGRPRSMCLGVTQRRPLQLRSSKLGDVAQPTTSTY